MEVDYWKKKRLGFCFFSGKGSLWLIIKCVEKKMTERDIEKIK